MNSQLFSKLLDFARTGDRPVDDENAVRFLRRWSDEDADFMATADVEQRIVTQQIKICRLQAGNTVYFGVAGLPVPDTIPYGLTHSEPTPGLFLPAVLAFGSIFATDLSATRVYDALNSDYRENGDGYDGHDLAIVQAFFRPIEFYLSNGDAPFHDDLERVLGAFVVASYFDGPLSLATTTRAALITAFEAGPAILPYRNLVQGVLSISWTGLFLEIYRCVEYLYAAKRVTALRDIVANNLAAVELSKILERELNWRAREDEAIRGLIGRCSEPLVRSLCAAFGVVQEQRTLDRLAVSVADEVYALRNAVVHFRPFHELPNKTEAEWNGVVVALLGVASHLYNGIGTQYLSEPEQPQG